MDSSIESSVLELIQTNRNLKSSGLVLFTWGNASLKTQDRVYIKPSGVPYEEIQINDISVVDFETGAHTGGMKPSVDTPTHLALYKHFPKVNSIIHTHSEYCTIFAQAKMPIPCLGTTHADYFYGDVPVIEDLAIDQIEKNYEHNTGIGIVNTFSKLNISYLDVPAALIPCHGVFVWGESLKQALERAVILEHVAKMAYKTLLLNSDTTLDKNILDKHFLRKHGDKKYYGQ